jgi:hypothetical protein
MLALVHYEVLLYCSRTVHVTVIEKNIMKIHHFDLCECIIHSIDMDKKGMEFFCQVESSALKF